MVYDESLIPQLKCHSPVSITSLMQNEKSINPVFNCLPSVCLASLDNLQIVVNVDHDKLTCLLTKGRMSLRSYDSSLNSWIAAVQTLLAEQFLFELRLVLLLAIRSLASHLSALSQGGRNLLLYGSPLFFYS